MDKFIYLFKYQDLFIIGAEKDINKAKEIYKRADLIAASKYNKPDNFLKRIQNQYEKKKLPNTNYYRLSKHESEKCAKIIVQDGGKKYIGPFFKGYRLFIAFVLVWITISLTIINYINPIFKNFN